LDSRALRRILLRAMSQPPLPAPLLPADRIPPPGGPLPGAGTGVDLRLDGNQGRPPSPEFWQHLGHDPELLRGYPAGNALEQAIAQRHGVDPARVVVGAGADEVLDRLCRAVLQRGRGFVLPVPTFEMLARYAHLAEGDLVRVPWCEGAYPRAQVLAAISPSTVLAAIVSPNNPTGLVATADDVAAVAGALRHGLVLVDAAYAEFADEDLTAAALAEPNTVVVRTLSKAWGLAGLRVGYAIAPLPVAAWMRAAGSPFTAGRLARHAALLRLATGTAEMEAYVAAVRAQRSALAQQMRGLGWDVLPPQGNFVFVRGGDGALLRDLLAGLGIAVRAFTFADGSGAPAGVRITVPGEDAPFLRVEAALRAVCAPQAIVLDLDGVLADIEGRRAIATVEDVAALARIVPLAVVTSCPRRLAESVLERHGFAPHIRVAICAEDGPGKPDPAPVQLALRRLGVAAAWMLGDNPSDVQAARAAGVVPLAIDPGNDTQAAQLRAAGAARLLGSVGALQALLSALPQRRV
jgi:histidinol-phosphate aminotransferase